ncbi:MAG: hypothetical protein O7F08_07325 [Deltaproteobacteria bacterium]|nr:hypothetical protein [Deltaproteobacteria bacterium]
MSQLQQRNLPVRTGFALFVAGNALAFAGLGLAAFGLAHGGYVAFVIGLMGAGEVLILGSILFLGDDGYQRLEARTSLILRRAADTKTIEVTRGRHRFGIALLVVHVLGYFLVWASGIIAYTRATLDDPLPTIGGLTFEQQGPAFVWAVVVCELLFATAIYVLGPTWWERFESLFRYDDTSGTREEAAAKQPSGLRYRLGLVVFVVGNLLAASGLILPALGLARGNAVGLIAVLMAAGEIVSLASIFLLGKEGFKELKHRLFSALKRTPPGGRVSAIRHRVAITFLVLYLVAQVAAVMLPIAAHYGSTGHGAFPEVLGLDHDEQLRWFVGLLVTAEVLFFAGVYTFGADWWGRFRDLFEWEGHA